MNPSEHVQTAETTDETSGADQTSGDALAADAELAPSELSEVDGGIKIGPVRVDFDIRIRF